MKIPSIPQTDELTGLYVRKAFAEEFHSAMARAKTEHSPLALAILDIDKFKQINDQFGHVAGDEVLFHIAGVIRALLPEESIAVRYGGDEFALVFPNCEREQAFLTIERVRHEVERQALKTGTPPQALPNLTVSAGVSAYPVDGSSESEIFRKADQALYRAKRTGRNKVRLAYEEKMVPKTAHFTQTQLERLTKLSGDQGVGEAELLREALDDLLIKYGVNDIET